MTRETKPPTAQDYTDLATHFPRMAEEMARISREANRLRAINAELLAACEMLDSIDWVIGYEVIRENQIILDQALTLARAAICKAKELTPKAGNQ